MTEVLHSSCSSSPSSISTPHHHPFNINQEDKKGKKVVSDADVKGRGENQLSLIALLVTLFRKSFLMACKAGSDGELCSSSSSDDGGGGGGGGGGLEISWPTDVQHVAHVTFDRFNGFRGLPVEFEPEVSRRAPSASATVFGVSTESMQLSFDTRGNSVPTILLLMQNRLYAQGGLQAEGIFRITAGNSQEEYVRDQLNRGIVPDGIDVHCLAGLIKAWFRELPRGILDPLTPEDVMQCQSPEHCVSLVRLLPPTEAALLDWAVNLMADVVVQEHLNKMNARNIAMVFAPNMTQMVDPLTALMYAVQVMNFLKTLIEKTLEEREEPIIDTPSSISSHLQPTEQDGNQSLSQLCVEDADESDVAEEETNHVFVVEEPDSDTDTATATAVDNDLDSYQVEENVSDEEFFCYLTSIEESESVSNITEASSVNDLTTSSNDSNQNQQPKSVGQEVVVNGSKRKELSKLNCINSITERSEAWQ